MSNQRCYFSVVSWNYMGYVKALETQIKLHEPNAVFFALVVDRPENHSEQETLPYDVHYVEDFVDRDWFRQATYFYNAFEISNACKSIGHRIAKDIYKANQWAYIDSDIYVCGPLDVLWDNKFDIILTSHCNTVVSGWPAREAELSFLRFGAANGGIVACRKSQAAESFVTWFEEAMRYGCFDEWNHSYVDQKWLDLIPALFDHVGFCRYAGMNVGHWNFHERPFKISPNGHVLINNEPLLAFHFSKWSPERWEEIPMNDTSVDREAWLILAKNYKELLFASGWKSYRHQGYRYMFDSTGRIITKDMRRAYFLSMNQKPDPWGTSRGNMARAGLRLILKKWLSDSAVAIGAVLRMAGLRK